MVRRHSVVVVALSVGLASAQSCAPPIPEITTQSTLAMPLGGPCPADASGGADFKSESDELRITVTADDIATPVEATGDVGALAVEAVPEGEGRIVGVFGLANGRAQWRAVARGVSVKADEETKIDVLMARIADVTCARSPDPSARTFHTTTTLQEGRVLIVGGAATLSADTATCPTCQKYTATSTTALYDPKTGTVSAAGSLSVPRLGHVAVLLEDGRVVVAGGARELIARTVDANNPFPLAPPAGTVLGSVEVFDPDSGTFTAVDGASCVGCAPRLFAAGAPTLQREAIITGGIPDADTPHDLGNALTTTTVCGGNPLTCRTGPPMSRPRAGHTAFLLKPDGVYLMGGSVDTSAVANVPGFQLERWDGSAAFTLLAVASMTVDRNVFFASTVQYVPFRVLVAGGLRRDAAGAFRAATIDVGGQQVAPVILYDATYNAQGGIVIGPNSSSPMALRGTRWFGAGAPLPGNTRAVFAGGFTGLDLSPSGDVDLFDEGAISVQPVAVGGQPRTLREPRGALSAAAIGDGTVVLSGGRADSDAPLATVEVFADPKTPAGVAE